MTKCFFKKPKLVFELNFNNMSYLTEYVYNITTLTNNQYIKLLLRYFLLLYIGLIILYSKNPKSKMLQNTKVLEP